jgi:hypothetical protein
VRRARTPATDCRTPRRPSRPMDAAASQRTSPSGSCRTVNRTDTCEHRSERVVASIHGWDAWDTILDVCGASAPITAFTCFRAMSSAAGSTKLGKLTAASPGPSLRGLPSYATSSRPWVPSTYQEGTNKCILRTGCTTRPTTKCAFNPGCSEEPTHQASTRLPSEHLSLEHGHQVLGGHREGYHAGPPRRDFVKHTIANGDGGSDGATYSHP